MKGLFQGGNYMSFSVFKINLSLFVFLSTAFLSIDNGIAGDEEKNISFPNDALLQTTAIEDPASFIDHSSRESLLISEGSLAHLPTEIIFHIFKYLERADV
ncbi:MAG: F-box protein, partial [Cytophagales bacterium]|nr:F-box protein [Cytophagales bacterium]